MSHFNGVGVMAQVALSDTVTFQAVHHSRVSKGIDNGGLTGIGDIADISRIGLQARTFLNMIYIARIPCNLHCIRLVFLTC